MTRILSVVLIIFFSNISYAETSSETRNKYFYIGKMKSYNDKFNGKKSSFFVENDDHMMDFNENLINSIELFITELN